jgi:5-methylcytosine-specific restriction endonuclease McrA
MAQRDVITGTYISNDENTSYTTKENQRRKAIYKKAIGHCCMPDCKHGFCLHIHHIFLVSQGGSDDFTNYIVLCGKCHGRRKIHQFSMEKKIELSVYKFYIENLELGFCSDEMSNEEFELRLRKLIAKKVNHE